MTIAGAPCWVELFTPDTDAARRFYEGLFGWTSASSGEEYGGDVIFERNGAPIAGCMHNDGTMGPRSWTVYLASDDIETTVAKASRNGATVVVAPMQVGEMGHMAFLTDPAGAHVGVWQPLKHQGFAVRNEIGAPAWFETYSKDYQASVAFYETVFGWDTEVMGDSDDFRYTTLGSDEAALAGIMDASTFLPAHVPSHWMFYVEVADTDAAAAKVAELGGELLQGPDDSPFGRLATIADPAGVPLKIMQGNPQE